MFTGIIRVVGEVLVRQARDGIELTLHATLPAPLSPGDSVAINGVCVTVLRVKGDEWHVRLMAETIERTTLGQLKPGDRCNVELPLAAGERFGGHFVMGHADGVAQLTSSRPAGADRVDTWRVPMNLARYIVPKGSVALNGVSLTVVETAGNAFTVSLMPYTLAHTTLGALSVGDTANLEVDMIGKYVAETVARLWERAVVTQAA